MLKKITTTSALALILLVSRSQTAFAQVTDKVREGVNTVDSGGNQLDFGTLFSRVVDFLLLIVGAISVIMIIIGGIRYVVSGGDQQAITDAKNTILYAIVGLIVAALAFVIVNFVLGQLEGNPAENTGLILDLVSIYSSN